VYEKLKPRNEEHVLFDLDKRMEEILTSKLSAHGKIKLYNKALQKSRFYEKKKRPKNPKEEKSLTELTLLKGYKKQTHAKRVLKAVYDNRSSGWN